MLVLVLCAVSTRHNHALVGAAFLSACAPEHLSPVFTKTDAQSAALGAGQITRCLGYEVNDAFSVLAATRSSWANEVVPSLSFVGWRTN